jgi:hypothetical protein
MSGEQMLIGNGIVTHQQAVNKATEEYRKYKARTLSEVEQMGHNNYTTYRR